MKKVYISLPISGQDLETVRMKADIAKKRMIVRGRDAVTPFDVCPYAGKSYAWYMGQDLEALLECDAIYMCRGWLHSKGCRLELAAAIIYGKKIIFEKI